MERMSERVVRYLDLGYKGAVIMGSLALIYANATFAKRTDIEEIRGEIHQLNASITITNDHIGGVREAITRLSGVDTDHEARIRELEKARR